MTMSKVLIIEDDITMIGLLKTLLGIDGYDVVAYDGDDNPSAPDTITITLTEVEDLNLIVSSPTGIVLERSKDSVKISIP